MVKGVIRGYQGSIWYLLSKPLQPSDYLFISFWISFGTFWLHLLYLLIAPLFPSDYPFGTFWIPPWNVPIGKAECTIGVIRRYQRVSRRK
jgi:hypothetical protein